MKIGQIMKVTVAVAVYNGSKYIPGCVKALSEQIYRDFEVLFVVDSKTDDDSVAVIESMIDILPSARVVMQRDKDRLAGARNIGVREAAGDIIWFLDVDDHPYPDFLSTLVPLMESTDSDMVFCNVMSVSDGRVPPEPEGDFPHRVTEGADALARMRDFPMYSWSRIQRKSIFDGGEVMFTNRPAIEDQEQTIKSLAVSRRVCYCSKPLYVYFKAPGTASSVNRKREPESMEAIARSTLDFVTEKAPEALLGFRRQILENLMRQMTFGTYREFRRVYAESIAKDILAEIPDRSLEMKVFSVLPTAYYAVLYPFSHRIWDRKVGLWDEGVVR